MLGDGGCVWPWICLRGDLGRLGGPYLAGMPHLEGLGGCFENLGRGSLALGRSSHEGSCNRWVWGVGFQDWLQNFSWGTLEVICDTFWDLLSHLMGLGNAFVNYAGISLFWAVALVRDLAMGGLRG